jgi:hypothetical protein
LYLLYGCCRSDIEIDINPLPKFMTSLPGIKQLTTYTVRRLTACSEPRSRHGQQRCIWFSAVCRPSFGHSGQQVAHFHNTHCCQPPMFAHLQHLFACGFVPTPPPPPLLCGCVQIGVEDVSIKGRVHISMSPMLYEVPVIGALQVSAYVRREGGREVLRTDNHRSAGVLVKGEKDLECWEMAS